MLAERKNYKNQMARTGIGRLKEFVVPSPSGLEHSSECVVFPQLYKVVHVASLGAEPGFDGMFVAVLLKLLDQSGCPSKVKRLRRKRTVLPAKSGGQVLKATGGEIFSRALYLAILRTSLPTAEDCASRSRSDSSRSFSNCDVINQWLNVHREWDGLVLNVGHGEMDKAKAVLSKLPHSIQEASSFDTQAFRRVRGRVGAQLQQILSFGKRFSSS